MGLFKLEPTKRAEWQALVAEAQLESGYQFEESIENYLILTLDNFTTKGGIVTSVFAIDLLEAIELSGKLGEDKLRTVGDECLLLSGLFPERIKRKNVSLAYIINIGQHAYKVLATKDILIAYDADLFSKLSDNFVGLMDLLNAMRHLPIKKQ